MILFLVACAQEPALLDVHPEPKAVPVSTVSLSAIDVATLATITNFTYTAPDGTSATSTDGSPVTLALPAGEHALLRLSAPGYREMTIPVFPERETWELQLRAISTTPPYPFPSLDYYYYWEFGGGVWDHADGQVMAVARTRDNYEYTRTFINYQGVAFDIDAAYDDLGDFDGSADTGSETNVQGEYGWVTFRNTAVGAAGVTVTAPEGTTCYAPGAATPLDGPLPVDVEADGITMVFVDCQPTLPASCYDVLADDPTTPDGFQTLYAAHDEGMAWRAWCADMESGDALEYLRFPRRGGNSSTYVAAPTQGTTVRTSWSGVRIDPETFVVDTSDQRFARSTGSLVDDGVTVTSMPYGVAMSCDGRGGSAVARMDLSGTPFVVADSFVDEAGTSVSPLGSEQVSVLRGGGACGWAQPAPGASRPVNQNGTTLELDWAM